jgi:hypothetical protein
MNVVAHRVKVTAKHINNDWADRRVWPCPVVQAIQDHFKDRVKFVSVSPCWVSLRWAPKLEFAHSDVPRSVTRLVNYVDQTREGRARLKKPKPFTFVLKIKTPKSFLRK